jgi:hypothetical protein
MDYQASHRRHDGPRKGRIQARTMKMHDREDESAENPKDGEDDQGHFPPGGANPDRCRGVWVRIHSCRADGGTDKLPAAASAASPFGQPFYGCVIWEARRWASKP